MWQWGRLVRTGLMLGDYTGVGGAKFCGWCLYWHRIWYRTILGKSSTFIGCNPKKGCDHFWIYQGIPSGNPADDALYVCDKCDAEKICYP